MRKTIFSISALLVISTSVTGIRCQAQVLTDEEIMEAIEEHPYRSAACYSPYYAPEVDYTPAPKGYKAFYVNHLGRHGSRYQNRPYEVYDHVVAMLDSLHLAKCLTAEGDSLRMELHHIQQISEPMKGMLTNRGAEEHKGIARRLASRCPSVFRQKDRNIVNCRATLVQRTIQSMAGFISGLDGAGKNLDFRIGCGFDVIDFNDPEYKPEKLKNKDSLIAAVSESLAPDDIKLDALRGRLYKDYRPSRDELYDLFVAAASAGCLDIDVDPIRFFTTEELFEFHKKRDFTFDVKYGTYAPTRPSVAYNGINWLRMMIDDADRAIEGNGHCADFRFAHDGNIGPVMLLLGIGGYSVTALEEAPYRYWQSFRQICMGSNLQLEYYRNAKSDILVKALYNEKEVGFPGLEPINKVYYRWDDVRRYMLSKCDKIREVPDYYVNHLKEKADKIRELQKDELDGFYFITDMHFPVNYGNAAALIESLENSTEKRLIVYGGDALTYVDDMQEGMAKQICALEQMRGVSPVLWARGNHDIVNYTRKMEWNKGERQTLPAWQSASVLARFRPVGAVANENDHYTSYYYFDNPGKKVRYVVFDSSDTVGDDNKQSGLSDVQLKWVIEKAILGAPKGYGLIFISHIPFIGSGERENAKQALSAFSEHSSYTLGDMSYDFGERPDLRLLCSVCGHHHRDFSNTFPGGQTQINFAADCNYEDIGRMKGTVEEQSFDYVSISRDGRTVRTVRIGKGEDRQFGN